MWAKNRSGPGCGTLLFACPGPGKCWEPEELSGRAGGEAEWVLCAVEGSGKTELYNVCKLRFVLENRCEPPPKSSVTLKCNADLATLLMLEKRDELLVWTL